MDNKAIAAGRGQGSSLSSPQKSSRSCSICSFKSYSASSSNNPSRSFNSGKKTILHPSATAGMGMLDASFVNIHSPTDANNKNDIIDSILSDALSHNNHVGASNNKGTLQEASTKMAAYAEAAMEMIQEAENADNISAEKVDEGEKYYCNDCIERKSFLSTPVFF
eukprot:scaffold43348_cov270-Skeletonema_marinoi.AAC.1